MTVIDETSYRSEDTHLEDIKGWVSCYQCMHCSLTSNSQLEPYGQFLCNATGKYRYAYDFVLYMCPLYTTKSCENCRYFEICDVDVKHLISFCSKYNPGWIYRVPKSAVGVRNNKGLRSRYSIEEEEAFLNYVCEEGKVNEDNQADRVGQAGEYQEDEEGDAGVGYIQIPDSYEEDKVDLASEEDD